VITGGLPLPCPPRPGDKPPGYPTDQLPDPLVDPLLVYLHGQVLNLREDFHHPSYQRMCL